ncbi:hypothetical protein ERJ75_000685600 [Trypanosoma vivax]|nr:hypothetical protein ERJ75_000685600 [Trypanosoma vivax]
MLRHTWDVILRIVRMRVSVNVQFVFSHCGVPRTEAADKAAEQGHAKRQSHPAWTTDVATGVEGRCGMRCAGALRRVGCDARIAVRYSVTSGERQKHSEVVVWARRHWRSSEEQRRSISGGYVGGAHARRDG